MSTLYLNVIKNQSERNVNVFKDKDFINTVMYTNILTINLSESAYFVDTQNDKILV